MKSGMLAAETAFAALMKLPEASRDPSSVIPLEMSSYEEALKESWVWKELHEVRNVRPSAHSALGMYGMFVYAGVFQYLFKGIEPFTLSHGAADHERTRPAAECTPIEYPKPDGVVSFDLLSSVALTGAQCTPFVQMRIECASNPNRIRIESVSESNPFQSRIRI